MKPRFSFSFRETRFLFLETPSILNMFFFRFFRKLTSFSISFENPTVFPLTLMRDFSKTHQSSLTLKGGSTAFPKPLSPQGTGDVLTALLGAQTASL